MADINVSLGFVHRFRIT